MRRRRKKNRRVSEQGRHKDLYLNRPFADLKALSSSCWQKQCGTRLNEPVERHEAAEKQQLTEDERCFQEAMKGVVPLEKENILPEPVCKRHNINIQENRDNDGQQVEFGKLIRGGWKLPVALTSEYVEGQGQGSDKLLTARLHQGHYSVKEYCELHGLDSVAALEECNLFMQNAIARNLSCVAFIHGRGLSSKGEPVIKKLVINWLKNGPFRHFVRAYASAPAWDGGAGVTYVLLSCRKRRKR
jgi:DNA-nicking Smr family endonuclease